MLLTMVLLSNNYHSSEVQNERHVHKMTCSDRRHLDFTCGAERQVTPKSGFLGILYTVRYTSIFTDIFNVLKILVIKS